MPRDTSSVKKAVAHKNANGVVLKRGPRSPPLTGERLKLLIDCVPMLEDHRFNKKPLKEVYVHVEKTWKGLWPEDFEGEEGNQKTSGLKGTRKMREEGVKKPVRERIEEWYNNRDKGKGSAAAKKIREEAKSAAASKSTIAGETSNSAVPASSGGPTPTIKIFNKPQRRNPAWMYWSKDAYDREVQPYTDHDFYLTTLKPGEPRWDPVTLRNKLIEVIYEEQSVEIKAVVEEFKRLSEIRLEDLLAEGDGEGAEEGEAAEKEKEAGEEGAAAAKEKDTGGESAATVDEQAQEDETTGHVRMARTTVDPESLSKEDLQERTRELINKAKDLGKSGKKAKTDAKNLPPLTFIQRQQAREKVLHEKLLDRQWATTTMGNTLFRGSKTLSQSSGWACFMIAGGPQLSGKGDVLVEASFGGPDNDMTFEDWDPDFFRTFKQKYTQYIEDYFDSTRRSHFGLKMATQFPGIYNMLEGTSAADGSGSKAASTAASASEDVEPELSSRRHRKKSQRRKFQSADTVDSDTSDNDNDAPTTRTTRAKGKQKAGTVSAAGDESDFLMHGATSDDMGALESGLSRNLNIVNRNRAIHGSPSKNRKRPLGDGSTPPDTSDADVLEAPARTKPQPRPKMKKRAKLADERLSPSRSQRSASGDHAAWRAVRDWASSEDESFSFVELEGAIAVKSLSR